MAKLYEEVRTDFSKAVSETFKGRKMSDEFCQKLSAARTGSKNPMYGKHHTDEVRRKLS